MIIKIINKKLQSNFHQELLASFLKCFSFVQFVDLTFEWLHFEEYPQITVILYLLNIVLSILQRPRVK
jgi:hypothetical protein